MRTPQVQYERDRTALKHYLIGRNYPEALAAMGIAERWHVGFRKNKVTPEFHHQIGVCYNFINTPIDKLTRKQESAALAALLAHDVVEDYSVTFDDLAAGGLSPLAVSLVKGMTKVKDETNDEFFERLLSHWLLPILKACDRDNNVMTMQGAFSQEKMLSYIGETKALILPLLKKASRLFPVHNRSYSALASGIKKQLIIYEGFIERITAMTDELRQIQLIAKASLPVPSIADANVNAEVISDLGRVEESLIPFA